MLLNDSIGECISLSLSGSPLIKLPESTQVKHQMSLKSNTFRKKYKPNGFQLPFQLAKVSSKFYVDTKLGTTENSNKSEFGRII